MYIGRFVIVGRTLAGEWYVGYRVSSRSYPNRYILPLEDRAVVLPTETAPSSDNPYITYNCLRTHDQVLVVANGSHVDPIIDKVQIGYPLRDAVALSLLALDYEHDKYNTPRVAAALNNRAGHGYLGTIGEGQLLVRRMEAAPGEAFLIATYERTEPTPIRLQGKTPVELCSAIYESEYEHPVAALAAMFQDGELDMAARSAEV